MIGGAEGHLGFQFDVPINDFTIAQGCADAPPNMCGVYIRPKNSTAGLSIEWGGNRRHSATSESDPRFIRQEQDRGTEGA
jgi:hypothetical protein